MPRFNLKAMILRQRNIRRRVITFREIAPPAVMAVDLFRACYRPVVVAWQQAIPALIAEYERSLAEITTDAAADVGREIDETDAAIAALLALLTFAVIRWATRTEQWHRRRWASNIASATGADIGPILAADPPAMLRVETNRPSRPLPGGRTPARPAPLPRAMVEASIPAGGAPRIVPATARDALEIAVERNVALIKDVSDHARSRIADAVYRGLQNRTSARVVAKEVKEAADMARARSLRVASHQLSALTAALDRERRREAGLDTFMWHHSRKQNFRPDHKSWDGKIFTEAKPPPDRAGEKPNCGCRERAVIRFD